MRGYATLLSTFWTGTTGKAITAAGKDVRILAAYLLTCEQANMLGVYRLPLLYAAEETGLKRREILTAFEQLSRLGFAQYDDPTEFVWVVEMARFQLGLQPGTPLKDTDHRKRGSARIYHQLPSNPFLGPFYDRYAEMLGLPLRRDVLSETKPHPSPFQGASKPLGRDYVPGPGPVLGPGRKGEVGETRTPSPAPAGLTPEAIQARWNGVPGVKPCKAMGKTICDRIRHRLREHPELAWWDDLLQRVRASDFLCGRTHGKEGPFQASLDWVLGPRTLDKILAGNYDSIASNGHAPSRTCTKRIQKPGDRFLSDCGQPASQESRSTEPRCAEHLTPALAQGARAS